MILGTKMETIGINSQYNTNYLKMLIIMVWFQEIDENN